LEPKREQVNPTVGWGEAKVDKERGVRKNQSGKKVRARPKGISSKSWGKKKEKAEEETAGLGIHPKLIKCGVLSVSKKGRATGGEKVAIT